ncbi:MAG: hypothetical protein GC168_17880 [Candidatus Hydrogenedens sp.]|nr:hypothetical protein [Candidatus Hydrogenedens sp.]
MNDHLQPATKRGLPLWVQGCGALTIIVLALAIPVLLGAHHSVYKHGCYMRMTQIRLALQLYASEYEPSGYFPLPSSEPGRLMFDLASLIPSGEAKPAVNVFGVMHCPLDIQHYRSLRKAHFLSTEAEVDDQSYFYLGYAVTGDASMLAFADAYRELIRTGSPTGGYVPVDSGSGTFGTDRLYRLHKKLPQTLVDSGAVIPGSPFENPEHAEWYASAEIPLLIERIELPKFPHHSGVGNHTIGPLERQAAGLVVYMDGHTRFLSYPGEWPMTETTMRALLALDALGKKSTGAAE